jgi:ferritin-like metal-binding protein YciE
MTIDTFDDLFMHLARDAYQAEKQHAKALPRMAKLAAHPELREAFEQHQEETEVQIESLEQIFEIMEAKPRGQRCEAADGLIGEAQEIMAEIEDEQIRDAGIIAAAQALEHYEIARYGTLVAWAQKMGERDVVRLLQQTLREEHNANQLLNQLAEQTINDEAMEADGDEDEAEDDEPDQDEDTPSAGRRGDDARGTAGRAAAQRGGPDRSGGGRGSARPGAAGRAGAGRSGAAQQPRRSPKPAGQANGNRSNARPMAAPDDLKQREYRDRSGQVRHHTRAYMRRHGSD